MARSTNSDFNPSTNGFPGRGSVQLPMNKTEIYRLLKNGKSLSDPKNTDPKLVTEIESYLARAMESIGINFIDPYNAYVTHFNKNNDMLNMDPQRPGNSFAFFTRPQINFSKMTLKGVPFFEYISKSKVGAMVMNLLQYPVTVGSAISIDNIYKPMSNFNPLMSNTCIKASGYKDYAMDRYDTEGDLAGNQNTYASGMDGTESIGEITFTFQDMMGTPLFLQHLIHFLYIHHVAKGNISPMKGMIINREIDYTISYYSFKLAEDNETIIRFSRHMGMFPINIPLDSLEHDMNPNMDTYDKVSITYAYNAYLPMDPPSIADFNQVSLSSPGALKNDDFLGKSADEIVEIIDGKSVLSPGKPTVPLRIYKDLSGLDTVNSLWSKTPYIVGNKLKWI